MMSQQNCAVQTLAVNNDTLDVETTDFKTNEVIGSVTALAA